MTANPLILKLVEQTAAKYRPERDLKDKISRQLIDHVSKAVEQRDRWFYRSYLPPSSVLVRLPFYDREALIAHFRAKEMREVADAMSTGNHYKAALARKRLARVNEVDTAFSNIAQDIYESQ